MLIVIAPRPYKKVARAQAQERTRNALLDVAEDAFYEGRWESTSLERLASKAGVTKQTLLRNFESKEGLLLNALIRAYSQLRDQRWSAPVGDIEGTVENLLDHYEAWGRRSLRIGAWLDAGNPVLAGLSRLARQVHYDWVEHVFAPWLGPLDAQTRQRRRDALIAICDVHTWSLLSLDLELDRPVVSATLTDAIRGIVGERR